MWAAARWAVPDENACGHHSSAATSGADAESAARVSVESAFSVRGHSFECTSQVPAEVFCLNQRGLSTEGSGRRRGHLHEMGHGVPGGDRRGAASELTGGPEALGPLPDRPGQRARVWHFPANSELHLQEALVRLMSAATQLEQVWSLTYVISEPTRRSSWKVSQGS